ncbi:DNA/RNA polymerase [Aspergillus ellipticus CBS 707.79]|uniref:DNA polymerase eta n=1 Tax=Aspergillus ellipticus CBS 707.79 TaxID=1448320 RepID=A0A319DMD8_9EURO|nr:DNA/RNA polymerase [Aspergillus ellipticus CBS 707.79]
MPRSSPEPLPSSFSSGNSLKQESRYTHRHLQLLRQSSTATPLRVIAHVDLDAFYAQCEMVRLETPRTVPLAVRQWDSLIAINYPARSFGITRMISASEAKNLCPEIVLQHVATFREGEGGKWAYRDDAYRRVNTDKVCLDPYRAESRKILKVMKDEIARWHSEIAGDGQGGLGGSGSLSLSSATQQAGIEKASVDEVFIDLSPLVYGVLLQRYPELRAEPHGDDRTTPLPAPPTTALEWNTGDCLVDLDETETEVDDPDWDDVATLIGAEIVRSVRKAVWDKLSYTCSAGVARNKMIAKLGSACNKPDKQTVVRNRAVQNFLGGYKFTKIRMLGGKLGDQVTALFGTEQVSDLLKVSLEQFRAKLDDDTANWLFGIIRGEDRSEVNSRTQIKSMLSAKSFRPSINTIDQADRWLRIFAADIYGRLVEDGVLEHKRRPRTVALHHRQGAQVRSRQIPIPGSSPIDETLLFELGKTLFRQVITDGRAWPCANLSLSVGGFEDGVSKNRAIDSFLLRGEQAKDAGKATREWTSEGPAEVQQLSEKRRKIDDSGIKRFFSKPSQTNPQPDPDDAEPGDAKETLEEHASATPRSDELSPQPAQLAPGLFTCSRCGSVLPEDEKDEHDDWHFAKDLADEDRQAASTSQQARGPPAQAGPSNSRNKASRSRGKPEKGQTRLTFG